MTRTELMARVQNLPKSERNRQMCELVGHSKVVRKSGNDVSCGRCGVPLAPASAQVVVGRKMLVDRQNHQTLTWRDTLYAAHPFTVGENHS